ncbi:integration host factor subunit alpha [Thiotrichales bacterium 19S11-10]|nr:integration host factor subunit alpha [Thiotrichales bacterium 19S11-10]MCF6807205.1 integration host factor subunit alpha [Thiotrichales bacterium 19S9-11]MCF6811174.1 integration host factor subunit alpha [Thiotrichales bacterium 19S9-12]
MNTLTKAEVIDAVVKSCHMTPDQARAFVDQFYMDIVNQLVSGKDVKLSGFGNFNLRRKSGRPGRNPKTGEEVPIQPRTVVTFKPGQKLKGKVQVALDRKKNHF